jgi:hypothetical protein
MGARGLKCRRRNAGKSLQVPLLGKAEKAQLEELVLQRLTELYDRDGADALMREGLRVVVDSRGVTIDNGEHADPLAAVAVRTLFTAMCYQPAAVPREALASLSAEAAHAAAAQINRIGPA